MDRAQLGDGRRRLSCALCGGAWIAPRLRCPFCEAWNSRDLVRLVAEGGEDALSRPISHCMTRDVVFATLPETVDTLMARMTDRRMRHLPVLESGRLAGIISIGDVVKLRIAEAEMEAEAARVRAEETELSAAVERDRGVLEESVENRKAAEEAFATEERRLAAAVRAKEVSSRELLDGYLARIERLTGRMLKPGNDSMGWIMTGVLGVAGSFLAQYAGTALGLYQQGDAAGWIASVVGAIILLVIYGMLKKS